MFSRGNGKTSSFYIYVYTILDHEQIGKKKKNETGYKQEQQKEGYRRYKKERVWNLYNYGCVVSFSCDSENWGEDLHRQTWHYQQNLELFVYFLKVSDQCLKILLSHCHVDFAFWELAVKLCYKKQGSFICINSFFPL